MYAVWQDLRHLDKLERQNVTKNGKIGMKMTEESVSML